jgi:hypothetical protein
MLHGACADAAWSLHSTSCSLSSLCSVACVMMRCWSIPRRHSLNPLYCPSVDTKAAQSEAAILSYQGSTVSILCTRTSGDGHSPLYAAQPLRSTACSTLCSIRLRSRSPSASSALCSKRSGSSSRRYLARVHPSRGGRWRISAYGAADIAEDEDTG